MKLPKIMLSCDIRPSPRVLRIWRVDGHSMLPTLRPGDLVISSSKITPKEGRTAIATPGENVIIKRIVKISGRTVDLEGDNKNQGHNAQIKLAK